MLEKTIQIADTSSPQQKIKQQEVKKLKKKNLFSNYFTKLFYLYFFIFYEYGMNLKNDQFPVG